MDDGRDAGAPGPRRPQEDTVACDLWRAVDALLRAGRRRTDAGGDAARPWCRASSEARMDEQTEPLDTLTRQAGRWLARSAAPAERHTTAVVAGPYDRVAWRGVPSATTSARSTT
ncbi:hypothetical protein GCM10010285_10550 [Streptomyces pseudogriseolus]|uniref:Uncharacterized protein n=2 Tax=Streptomyces TaxID=1883 RepID=A0ABQ2SP49_STREZ|nr:hypothetical protein GCM10010285_10550 [Streptomyces rubiginosus]